MTSAENITPEDEIEAGMPPRTRCRRTDCREDRAAALHDIQAMSEEADIQYQVAHAVALLLLDARDQFGEYRTAHPCTHGSHGPQTGSSEPPYAPVQVQGQLTLVDEL